MFCLTVLVTLLGFIYPSLADTSPSSTLHHNPCAFEGDDNLYGLGIRLGIYFQWMTTSIANNFLPDDATNMRFTNTCFQLAVLSGLIYSTVSPSSRPDSRPILAAEAYPVLLLCIGGVCASRGRDNSIAIKGGAAATPTVPPFENHKITGLGQLMRALIGSATVFYGIWFVYRGMDGMVQPSCPCHAFFFTQVDLFHWFRILLKIGFTCTGIAGALLLLRMVLSVFEISRLSGFLPGISSILGMTEVRNDLPTSDVTSTSEKNDIILLHHTTITWDLPFWILAVELPIRWNAIKGVNSVGNVGQLIPLIIGGSGLFSVLYKACNKAIHGLYRFPPTYTLMLPIPTYIRRSNKRKGGLQISIGQGTPPASANDTELQDIQV